MPRGSSNQYEKEELISALRTVAERTDKYLSKKKYNKKRDDSMPSADTIRNRFDKWNIAKKEAGLKQKEPKNAGRPIEKPPDNIDTDYKEWASWRRDRRWRKRKQAKLYELKLERGCEMCDYNKHPSALDFHHLNSEEKKDSVSKLVRQSSWDSVKEEIKKCQLLCANCHREQTSNEEDLFVWSE